MRWLTKKSRHEEAWRNLKWIRADDRPADSSDEMEIKETVQMEERALEGFPLRKVSLLAPNVKRTARGWRASPPRTPAGDNASSCVSRRLRHYKVAQQSVGATAFAYYGPQYFKLLVGGGDKGLLLTGIFGAVKVIACGIFVLFLADRVGRRSGPDRRRRLHGCVSDHHRRCREEHPHRSREILPLLASQQSL